MALTQRLFDRLDQARVIRRGARGETAAGAVLSFDARAVALGPLCAVEFGVGSLGLSPDGRLGLLAIGIGVGVF